MEKPLKLYDVTLRDGNHALRHTLEPSFVSEYCKIANDSDVWAVEVGHGNGLGASSFLVGKSRYSDFEILSAARENLTNPKLAVHAIPGFATIKRDLVPALKIGVDIFRIATHVTEVSVAQTHVEFLVNKGVEVQGVLMMSHMAELPKLLEQINIFVEYGVSAVILMDSAGYFQPNEVAVRVKAIKDKYDIEVGFHAHNNLGVGISNAIVANNEGASIIDGAAMGLGAGAGNAQLELIVANLNRSKNFSYSLKSFFEMSEIVERNKNQFLPRITSSSIESGINGVFSGYAPQVNQLASETGISRSEIWQEIARRKLVAGQESLIREIANDLMNL